MIKDMQYNLILASGSPRRVDLLTNLGLKFKVCPSDVDESISPDIEPQISVATIAKRKALKVFNQLNNQDTSIVLAADTSVFLDDVMLSKPKSKGNAIEILKKLSGKQHYVLTGVCLLMRDNGEIILKEAVETSQVKFRELNEIEIRAYVETEESMDKAGAYALQGIGSAFVESISGCYTNIIGLPIPLTISLLRKMNLTILGL